MALQPSQDNSFWAQAGEDETLRFLHQKTLSGLTLVCTKIPPAQDPLVNCNSSHFPSTKNICWCPLQQWMVTSFCIARCLQHASLLPCSHEDQLSARCSVPAKVWKEPRHGEKRWNLGNSTADPRVHTGWCYMPCKVVQPTAGHEGTTTTSIPHQGFSSNCPSQFGKLRCLIT